MLHAILSALSGVTLDTEEPEEASDTSAPLQHNEAICQGSKTWSLVFEDVLWLPQQILYQRVWETIALELALRRGMSEEKAVVVL